MTVSSSAIAPVVSFCVFVSVVTVSSSPLASEALPLFTSFKALCIDTDAKADAVEPAVIAKGGRPIRPGLSVVTGGSAERIQIWTLVVGGRELKVDSWVAYSAAHRDWPAYEIEKCSIQSSNDEAPSIAAVRAWVGLSPDREDDFRIGYTYYQFGSKRVQARHRNVATFMKAVAAGNTYDLEIIQSGGTTELILTRYHLPTR